MPKNLKPHVICISETRLKMIFAKTSQFLDIHFYIKNSLTNAGGVGINILNTLQFEEIDLKANLPGTENLWIRIKSSVVNTTYVVGAVYRHPNSNKKNFIECLNEAITELSNVKCYYFILGDININTSSKTSHLTQEYLNMLASNSASSVITSPTRVTDITSTVLDHILTNESRYSLTPFVINYVISDHYPVMVLISCKFTPSSTSQKLVKSQNHKSLIIFLLMISIKTCSKDLIVFAKYFNDISIQPR